MYLGYQGNKIKFYTEEELSAELYSLDRSVYTEDEYVLDGDEYVLNDAEYQKKQAQKERERIAMLHMTPLDFLKAIIQLGISYDTIKGIMEANPEVDMEMKYCQNVYRGHPMLEQFATQFGVTSEQLDNIFIEANGGY